MTVSRHLRFTSQLFQHLPGEEDQTNPGILGKALAEWLAEQLRAREISVDEIVPEDFGWAVILTHRPFLLWVACGNVDNKEDRWLVYPVAERGLLQRLFKKIDTAPAIADLERHLDQIIHSIPDVSQVAREEY